MKALKRKSDSEPVLLRRTSSQGYREAAEPIPGSTEHSLTHTHREGYREMPEPVPGSTEHLHTYSFRGDIQR